MELFGFINVFGLMFAVILAIPNIVYAKTHRVDLSVIDNRAMLYIERIGKYSSLILMSFNIGVLEEGFTSPVMQKYWIVSTTLLTAVYVILWIMFFKKETKGFAYLLIITASFIVIQSGLLEVKTLLLTAGIVYLIGEMYVTSKMFKS